MSIITFYSFLESFVYLCDFHREQSWDRWLSATHNGMNTKKSDVLLLLRPQALSDDDFNEALNLLQVRNLKYWVIWHIADILITIPLNQNNNLPDTITKLNYDCISHIIYLFDLHHVTTGIVEGIHYWEIAHSKLVVMRICFIFL